MSWEKRGNQIYYYRKRRLAGSKKIDSTYWGNKEGAMDIANLDSKCSFLARVAKDKEQAEKEKYKAFDRQIAQIDSFIRCLTRAVFLINDYHFHKGSLRKLRKPIKEKENELTSNISKQ